MSYQVVKTKRAVADVVNIHLYITQELRARQAADNLVDEFEKHLLELRFMPNRYPLVFDKKLAMRGIRKIPVNNYIIFYRVNEKTKRVTVLRVLYGSRDWVNII